MNDVLYDTLAGVLLIAVVFIIDREKLKKLSGYAKGFFVKK